MIKKLFLILTILLPSVALSQKTTNEKPTTYLTGIQSTNTVCIPYARQVYLYRTIKDFEKFKIAYVEKYKAGLYKDTTIRKLTSVVVEKDSIIAWYKRAFAIEQALRQDSDKKVDIWKGRAKRRQGKLIITLGAVGLYTSYLFLK